ncbi:hypothetical protein PoB_002204600 [Plakobranchus ocellatus]|uniref:Uncharacterized protein n=1 Tax=Plakobranchus ocellatus TaxID=259542 RepID=A0AAV3Z8A7_9GAST|nr:hypothetical protein PoB_002204600 [Plakobranchus ocellatus]
MRALTILLLVVAASLAVVVSGDEEKHREKRLFGGILNLAKTFKDRISGVAKDVGKSTKVAFSSSFKWASDFSRSEYIDARKTFKKVIPKVDFNVAVRKVMNLMDSEFVVSLCEFSCASAASSVFSSSSQVAQGRADNVAEIGCGPICEGKATGSRPHHENKRRHISHGVCQYLAGDHFGIIDDFEVSPRLQEN